MAVHITGTREPKAHSRGQHLRAEHSRTCHSCGVPVVQLTLSAEHYVYVARDTAPFEDRMAIPGRQVKVRRLSAPSACPGFRSLVGCTSHPRDPDLAVVPSSATDTYCL